MHNQTQAVVKMSLSFPWLPYSKLYPLSSLQNFLHSTYHQKYIIYLFIVLLPPEYKLQRVDIFVYFVHRYTSSI